MRASDPLTDWKALRLAMILLLAAIAGKTDTYPRQPGIDVQHYTYHLILRDDTDEIAADASVDLRLLGSGTTALLSMSLRPPAAKA
jgi:hypothetical protein